MDSKSLSHTKWKCQYYIVFIPKYRKKKLHGRLRKDVREVIKNLCRYKNVEIIEEAVCSDHVHRCSFLSKLSMPKFMGYLEGKNALMIYDEHPGSGSKYNKSFSAREYYVATTGNITKDTIKNIPKSSQRNPEKSIIPVPILAVASKRVRNTPPLGKRQPTLIGLISNHQLNWWLMT